MATTTASDFQIYDALFHSARVETIQQNVQAFNAASNGALQLAARDLQGDFAKESFFTETLTDSDNDDWMINQILVEHNTTNAFTNSTATIKVGGDTVTDPVVDIATLEEEWSQVAPWDLEWPSNRDFEFSWTNEEDTGETVDVQLWVEEMSGGGG